MSVTSIEKDAERLTMTVTAEYGVTADRAWQLWSDPRQLERWWGPPTWPATVERHELSPEGRVTYYMSGPEGEKARGYWDVVEVDAPRRLVVTDGFADENGDPDGSMPTMQMRMEINDRPGGVTMTITTQFPSLAAMEQLTSMGMEEGFSLAIGQIDAILAG